MRPRETDPMDGVTPKQLQVLGHIAAFHGRQRYSPTIAEVAGQLGLSRSTVFEHIGALQRKALLTTSPGRARSLTLTVRGRRLLRRARLDAPDDERARAGVPLRGQVAAGVPIEAVENEDNLSFESCFGAQDDLFALQVCGDSMIEDDIRPGDYVLCRRAATAENGQLVVALVQDGEATLKRFYKEKDRARLQPANARCVPLYTNECRIEAVVVGLLRKLS